MKLYKYKIDNFCLNYINMIIINYEKSIIKNNIYSSIIFYVEKCKIELLWNIRLDNSYNYLIIHTNEEKIIKDIIDIFSWLELEEVIHSKN